MIHVRNFIIFVLALSSGMCAQVSLETSSEPKKRAIKKSIAPSKNEESLIVSLYTERSQYKPQSMYFSSLSIQREKTMQGLYEEVAKKLTKDYEDTARKSMMDFPSPNKVFEPLTPDDFLLYNKGRCVLNYLDVVVDRLTRRDDPTWGDKYVGLSVHLTDSGKKKIGWIYPFSSVYTDPFRGTAGFSNHKD